MAGLWKQTVVIGSYTAPFTVRDLVLRFVLPVAGFVIVTLVIRLVIGRIAGRRVTNEITRRRILLWSRRVLRIVVVIGVFLSAGSLLGARAYRGVLTAFRVLKTPFFTSGNTQISVVTLLLFIPVFTASTWAGRMVTRAVEKKSLRRFGLDAEQSFTVGRLVRYSVMVIVFILGMSVIGIDLSAIGVLFGVLGIGIGFGLQSLVADFFAGISLISMGLVKEGDRISISGFDGIIRHIRLVNTELVTFEHETLIIPNRQLTGGPIHNYSYKDQSVIIVNDVDVSYGSDLDHVTGVLEQVGTRNPWRMDNADIAVRVMRFGDSGITMQLRTWIRDVHYRPEASSWTNLEIWRAFRLNGIEIPFPQRVVHLKPPAGDLKAAGPDS